MEKQVDKEIDKLVPDTSVVIEGLVTKKIEKKEIIPELVIIHEAILAELEHQANQNMLKGFYGLDELKKLREVCEKNGINLLFAGQRPGIEKKFGKLGEIDTLIRDLAFAEGGVLFTADRVQAEVAKAKGIPVIFHEIESKIKKLELEKFFDEHTMSVHLKEGVPPMAKKGQPGNWKFVKLSEKPIKSNEIREIAREIIESSGVLRDSFIEIEREGSTIVQLQNYRIVIVKPPFANSYEITAVKPVKKLSLQDYHLSEKIAERLKQKAEGILIAGAPGMGKSTFAQALGEFFVSQNKIVKTVEAPRDLVLPKEVTQLAISHGTPQEVHDILLLSRPDYTIFDEMRNTDDFLLFSDLRLAGVGMVGVVHATNPIDAIQRFIGRIELGVIPQVIDTVIFIKNGSINKVFSVNMQVKVPTGMTEADLARPVVTVTDFETGKLEFEIYSYGEETVVIPVAKEHKSSIQKLAEESIKKYFGKYSDVKVDLLSNNKALVTVPEKYISEIIGKQGKNISNIEKKLGISIEINRVKPKNEKREISYDFKISGKNITLYLEKGMENKDVDLYVDDEYLLSAHISKKSEIKIKKNSQVGRQIVSALNLNSLKIVS